MQEAYRAIERLVAEAKLEKHWVNLNAANLPAGEAILNKPDDERIRCFKAAVERYHAHAPQTPYCNGGAALLSLLTTISARKLRFADDDLIEIARYRSAFAPRLHSQTPLLPIVKEFERRANKRALPEHLAPVFKELISAHHPHAEDRAWNKKYYIVKRLLELPPEVPLLYDAEPWARNANDYLAKLPTERRNAWMALFGAGRNCRSSAPSSKWLGEATKLIEAIGKDELLRHCLQWLPLLDDTPLAGNLRSTASAVYGGAIEENRRALRGLIWALSRLSSPAIPALLGDTAWICLKKVPGIGGRHVMVGNACIWSLSQLEDKNAVTQLNRLALRLKKPSVAKQVESALLESSARLGVTPDELVETSVPTFGMSSPGLLEREFDPCLARIEISGRSAVLSWINEKGKPTRSVPEAVRLRYPNELPSLKSMLKEINALVPAQCERLERLLLAERAWPLKEWRERYLDHPLVGTIARRLVWHFSSGRSKSLLCWFDGALRDLAGHAVEPSFEAVVRLWHPIGFDANTIRAWRGWLEEREIQQPFKQAHREIYILTDAEIRTGTYSNRFAAHILKQHQFQALLQQRGWRYKLQGGWDSHNTPYLDLPRFNLRVEFFVEAAGNEMTPAGIHVHVATDQVRFERDGQPLPLAEVPALAFSEAMRDVDLFVGVCSVGNDPEWQDQGNREGFGSYWRSFSFGELNETAKTRREVLERLVPRLKIARRCRFEDRFLVVRGDLRTYKIHLGSGNILMEPNDQYLCIVPGREAASQKVMLPFEGDRTLSIIISKALLLADDKSIADETITRQLAI